MTVCAAPGRSSYVNKACRCDACAEANRAYWREITRRRSQWPPEAVPHGWNGYVNYFCRCDVCTEGARLTHARRRARRRLADGLPLTPFLQQILEAAS